MLPYVLLVEDNPEHQELTQRAFRRHGQFAVVTVPDGRRALDFLLMRGDHERRAAPDPAIIILDLGLPDISGHEVLRAIKSDPRLRVIPTLVLTVSERDEDRDAALREGANFFAIKPVQHQDFEALVAAVSNFWTSVAVRPPEDPHTHGGRKLTE